ncbi:MAG TPA: cytochrome c oxidase subunit I [Proteobacteria bacterium]|nr:cytochrome c oxidase subunit I [Pseudomonadota bacterium]
MNERVAHVTGVHWIDWCLRWVMTTNHKDIGSLYLWFSLVMFFVAGAMALVIRAELSAPGMQFVNPNFYNQMVTLHGLIMIFGAIMPALAGFANWMIPLMIGAPDMAFPRLNNWSFWLLPVGMGLLISTLWMQGGAPNYGWTFYAPLSTSYGPPSTDYMILSIHVLGISSILGSLNFVATVITMRAPGMTYARMPIFVWSWFITALLVLAIMPVLAGTVTLMLTDRHFGTSFFNAAGGGDPVLFQHLFWFFGHPEVYVLALPAFGIISEVVPSFSRKPIFGKMSMIYAIVCIFVLSFIVWVHHMFTSGVGLGIQIFFMATTLLVAVPTGVKVFNWLATMWDGSLSFEAPMLFAVAFIALFTFGGLSGVMLGIVPLDYQYQDTYFVVGHFHYMIVTGVYFAILSGVYYWYPKWTGYYYSESVAAWHFWLSTISANFTFLPMQFLGLAGMPRRIPDYALQFADFNLIASIGGFIFGFSQLLFVFALLQGFWLKRKATPQVWEGARGLEWTVDSPAPEHTFSRVPTVTDKLYQYD